MSVDGLLSLFYWTTRNIPEKQEHQRDVKKEVFSSEGYHRIKRETEDDRSRHQKNNVIALLYYNAVLTYVGVRNIMVVIEGVETIPTFNLHYSFFLVSIRDSWCFNLVRR